MRAAVKDLGDIAAQWLDTVLFPKSNALQTAAVMFAFLQYKEQMINLFAPLLLPDAAGMFDLDKARASAEQALNKAGGSITIPYINYKFDTADLQQLFEIAQGFSK